MRVTKYLLMNHNKVIFAYNKMFDIMQWIAMKGHLQIVFVCRFTATQRDSIEVATESFMKYISISLCAKRWHSITVDIQIEKH